MSEYSFRSDIADELVGDSSSDDYKVESKKYKDILATHISVLKENNSLNKKIGDYISISFSDIEDKQSRNDIKELMNEYLKMLFLKHHLSDNGKVLVVGLGNQDFSADALGPLASKNVIVTNHLFEMDGFEFNKGTKLVSLITPGVMGQTGLESADIVKGVCDFLNPELVIFIDALATRNIERINRVIQITDTGISPGSGIGNNRKELSEEYLKAPCICIGVATVVGVTSIVSDTLDIIENIYGKIPYSYSPLKEKNRERIISLVLEKKNLDMIVTPKQIDEDISNLAFIISSSINESLHLNESNL